jgi:hypothetical protein
LRRFAKPLTVLAALVVLALVVSACASIKPGSLALSQPGGVGPVRVHFLLCTEFEEATCKPNKEKETLQYVLGIAVPKGSVAPATVTAVPITGGATPIVFSRNDQVGAEIAAATATFEELPWPPPGLEGIGYLSQAHPEKEGTVEEWSVDADFGLPTGADGGSFSGPFASGLAFGAREISPGHPPTAPVHCWRISEEEPQEGYAVCTGTTQQAQIGTSDLRIGVPPTPSVFVGGKVPLNFALDFASTAATSPTFTLGATTTVPGGVATLTSGTAFTPAPVAATTHRSAGSSPVTVTVPKGVKPGTYTVTLTATAAAGGVVSQVAQLKVKKPKLKLGGVKLNKVKGTATLKVTVPGGGKLTVSGKGIVGVKSTSKGPKTLKVTIKAKGNAKIALGELGKAKVKAKLTFKPTSGAPVIKSKSITLKQLAG